MKFSSFICFIICLLVSSKAEGQSLSSSLDSISNQILKTQVRKQKHRLKFNQILKQRKNNQMKSFIMTNQNDYIIIKEFYNQYDSLGNYVLEVFNVGDSIPVKIYMNDSIIDIHDRYSSYFGRESLRIKNEEYLIPKSKRIKSFKVYQEFAYDSIQARTCGCVGCAFTEKQFKRMQRERIKNTHVIYTLIDGTTNTIWTSFQYGARRPKFKIIKYYPVWDF